MDAITAYRITNYLNTMTNEDFKQFVFMYAMTNPEDFLQTQQMNGLPAAKLAEIKAYILNGQKINAIRVYRDFTKKGLKESKDFVDALDVSQ